MDNGLIFPYRQSCVPDEAGDANRPKLVVTLPSGGERWVERGIRSGSSQAMG
jgi:hypothetical protein